MDLAGWVIRTRVSRAWTVWLCLGVVAMATPGMAQNHKLAGEKRKEIEAAVGSFMKAGQVPGLAVAVVEKGKFEWSKGFGMADLENAVPVTPQTLFRLASVSKPITAVAALELWERGKLDLDAPIQKYCPAYPEKPWPITTRELLEHRGGIRHYKSENDDETNNTKHFDDPISGGIQFFAKDPLVAEPGTKFSYSTQGYTLVGCVIEGASGEKYVDFIKENVFDPAGMTSTPWDNRFAIIPHRTRFYSKSDGGPVQNAEFLDASYKIPGGGWLSSADDMARFEVAILHDRLLKKATEDVMWTQVTPPANGNRAGYALGWGTGTIDGLPDVGHSGGQQGASTFIMLVPGREAGVVVLINIDSAKGSDLAEQIMEIVLKK